MKKAMWVSWREIDLLTESVIKQIKTDIVGLSIIKDIYAIPRGGMVFAVMLSHNLQLPIIEKNQVTDTTLIVDDISDTGSTIFQFLLSKGIESVYPKYSATLFVREKTKYVPTYKGKDIFNNRWLIFPWERNLY